MADKVNLVSQLHQAARLEFEQGNEKHVAQKIDSIIAWLEEIQAIDTDSLEPLINLLHDSCINYFSQNSTSIHPEVKDEFFNLSETNAGKVFAVKKVIE